MFNESAIKATLTHALFSHPPNPSQLSVEQTLTRFVKISNERKMALPTQMVLVCSGVILKIQTKANLISKNTQKVSRTI